MDDLVALVSPRPNIVRLVVLRFDRAHLTKTWESPDLNPHVTFGRAEDYEHNHRAEIPLYLPEQGTIHFFKWTGSKYTGYEDMLKPPPDVPPPPSAAERFHWEQQSDTSGNMTKTYLLLDDKRLIEMHPTCFSGGSVRGQS